MPSFYGPRKESDDMNLKTPQNRLKFPPTFAQETMLRLINLPNKQQQASSKHQAQLRSMDLFEWHLVWSNSEAPQKNTVRSAAASVRWSMEMNSSDQDAAIHIHWWHGVFVAWWPDAQDSATLSGREGIPEAALVREQGLQLLTNSLMISSWVLLPRSPATCLEM